MTRENIKHKFTKSLCILQFVRNRTLFMTNNWQKPANIGKIDYINKLLIEKQKNVSFFYPEFVVGER